MDNYDVIAYIGQFCDWRTFIRLRGTCRKVRERLPITEVPDHIKLNNKILFTLPLLKSLNARNNQSITNDSISKLASLITLTAYNNPNITIKR